MIPACFLDDRIQKITHICQNASQELLWCTPHTEGGEQKPEINTPLIIHTWKILSYRTSCQLTLTLKYKSIRRQKIRKNFQWPYAITIFFSKMSAKKEVYLKNFFLVFAPQVGLSGVGVFFFFKNRLDSSGFNCVKRSG